MTSIYTALIKRLVNTTTQSVPILKEEMLEKDGRSSRTDMDGGEEDKLKSAMERSTTEDGEKEITFVNLRLTATTTFS